MRRIRQKTKIIFKISVCHIIPVDFFFKKNGLQKFFTLLKSKERNMKLTCIH